MAEGSEQEGRRDFVKYTFFKLADRRGYRIGDSGDLKAEFAAVLGEFAGRVAVSSYSLVGMRGDADFLLWMVSPTLEGINELSAALNRTALGAFLATPYSYLGMTRRSPYVVDHRHEGQDGGGGGAADGGAEVFVYVSVHQDA